MTLIFKDKNKKIHIISKEIQDEQQAIDTIISYCRTNNYTINYIRTWDKGNRIVFDFGSHVEFFYLYLKGGHYEIKCNATRNDKTEV